MKISQSVLPILLQFIVRGPKKIQKEKCKLPRANISDFRLHSTRYGKQSHKLPLNNFWRFHLDEKSVKMELYVRCFFPKSSGRLLLSVCTCRFKARCFTNQSASVHSNFPPFAREGGLGFVMDKMDMWSYSPLDSTTSGRTCVCNPRL